MTAFEQGILTVQLSDAGARSAFGQAILARKAQLLQQGLVAMSSAPVIPPPRSADLPSMPPSAASVPSREDVATAMATAMVNSSPEAPIRGWTTAAKILGVSTDTLGRRRSKRGDTTDAWWPDRAALVTWWMALIVNDRPPAREPRPRAAKHAAVSPSATEADLSREVAAIVKAARKRRS